MGAVEHPDYDGALIHQVVESWPTQIVEEWLRLRIFFAPLMYPGYKELERCCRLRALDVSALRAAKLN